MQSISHAVCSPKLWTRQWELPLQWNYCLSCPSILPPFLSAHVEYCMTFYMLLKKVKKLFYIRNQKVLSKLFINAWGVKILTGRKFEMQCLSSVFLSRGLTQAALALLPKMLHLKLLFIAIDNGVLKGSTAILIKGGGILSWKIAFLELIFLRYYLTLSLYTGEKIVLSLVFCFAVIVLLIFKMLG